MIEINLLPGDGKKKKRAKAVTGTGLRLAFHPGRWFAGITQKVSDKYMLGAVGSVALSGALISFMFIHQAAQASSLNARETKAVQDSSRFSAVLAATARAEAARDSLYRQIAIIKSIDDMRYTWSHLMYEISNALPQYTWLTSISQTSAPRSAAVPDSAAPAAAAPGDTAGKKRVTAADRARARNARSDSTIAASKEISFRILGQTVDIQALTRFMKSLEASPFIQNVQLSRSELVMSDGKEVTQFLLEAQTQTPPPFVVKTVPLVTQPVQ
ncbi:MAG TPA: PilN domain-containing protein [Gemmatimonadaceae bacterium]|jgi:Tfp pilus assembly protein PilN|nr:PilN domain-containing protein [Gemmatimonadaceae bacterium]